MTEPRDTRRTKLFELFRKYCDKRVVPVKSTETEDGVAWTERIVREYMK